MSKVCISRQQTPNSFSRSHGSLLIKDGRERKQPFHAKEFLQRRVETLFFEKNKQASKQAKEKTNSIQSINQLYLKMRVNA